MVSLDVGGTAMKGALVSFSSSLEAYDIPAQKTWPTPSTYEAVVDAIAEAFAELIAGAPSYGLDEPVAAGLVVPGIVDSERGIAVVASNLPFRNAPLVATLEARLGLPVVIGHDVRAGGLAENHLGSAVDAENALFLPLGTGIAAAVIVDGAPLEGGGYAGELGHVSVDPEGERCPCGGRGCLERFASASAIARHYTERSGVEVDGSAAVADLVRSGDPIANAVWDEAIDALVRILHTAVTLFGTEVIVIGGGLSAAGELLLDPLTARLEASLTFQRRPRLVRAALGDQAGCLGAALLAARKGMRT